MICAACVLFVGAVAGAETVNIPASADGSLWEWMPTAVTGNAADTRLRVGTVGARGNNTRARGLFKFDVAGAIPAGSTINSVRLKVHVTRAVDFEPRDFDLHRMLVPWTEEVVCWDVRAEPGVPWSQPGAGADADYAAFASGSGLIGNPTLFGTPTEFIFPSAPDLVADVQGWLDDPAANNGWLMRRANELDPFTARALVSREAAGGAPQLEVTYTPFRIESVSVQSGNLCLSFTAEAGKSYTVEFRNDFGVGTWTTLTNLPPADATGPVTVCRPLIGERRFFRVGELPPLP